MTFCNAVPQGHVQLEGATWLEEGSKKRKSALHDVLDIFDINLKTGIWRECLLLIEWQSKR